MNKKLHIVIGAIFLMLNLAATTRANLVANTNDSARTFHMSARKPSS